MLLSCCVIILFVLFVVLIWFSFGLLLITKGMKEKKRGDQEEKAGTLPYLVREAKEEKQHLQTRNQTRRLYGEESLLKVQVIPIRDENSTTSASK